MELAEGLYKPVINKFKERKVHSLFRDNIWGADLADMQFIRNFNERIRFLLCFIDTLSKYAWVITLKDKKVLQLVLFILNESNRKPKKIWVDKCSEFCTRSIKPWLEKMLWKCIQHITKENLSLLKDVIEP